VTVDLWGNLVSSEKVYITFSESDDYFKKVGQIIDNIVVKSGIKCDKILGVGIAVPAIVSEDKTSICHTSILGFANGTSNHFARFTPYPCELCNDANAGGIAELWLDPKSENAIYISLNNTIGGAILFNNQIYPGENQRSGEFGHMTLVDGGRRCYCGQRGCVDAYCSASILSNTANGNLDDFFKMVRQGSVHHVNLWYDYLNYLAITINNLRMVFDCNVILGGYVGVYMDEYLDTLRKIVSERETYESSGLYIRACQYKMHATAVGAALVFIERFLKDV
jgi:predicted NBD/HSP70 family sugar kinase